MSLTSIQGKLCTFTPCSIFYVGSPDVTRRIDRRRSIEEDRRLIEGDRRSEKKRRRRKRREKEEEKKQNLYRRRLQVACALSSSTGHPRAIVIRIRGRFFSRVRRRNVSPCGEKDRGDITSAMSPLFMIVLRLFFNIPGGMYSAYRPVSYHTGTDKMSVCAYRLVSYHTGTDKMSAHRYRL
ncbi:hypothetical protein BHE74_00032789, partial [Ensete ventricosum]